MDIFERIRERCAWVAERSTHVHLQLERIPAFAADLASTAVAPPQIDRIHHYVDPLNDEAGTAAFFVTLDAVNFGSGYFPHLQKRPGCSGYFTIASRLAERFRTEGPISAEELAGCRSEDCARIFGQDLAVPEMAELMSLFAEAWRDLGQDLIDHYDAEFSTLIGAAEQSAAHLIEILDSQPFFHDVFTYGRTKVPIYKRAQILASDLALAFEGQGPGAFVDLDHLTIFADNLVPHVLRVKGILEYEPDLASRIEAGHPIPSGATEEIELRACAVHGVECIASALRQQGHLLTSRDLDLILWNLGQDPQIKGIAPRHRTRCVYY